MRSKTNFRVSFFLKKTKLLKSGEASVSMRITVDGQRVENNIRKSILPNLWDQLDILNKLTPYGLFKLTPIDNL